jgi:cyclopropane fatty-acyl-phospholipid synthase-like methyltransferase
LVARAKIKNGCRILDVGCGLGGSAIFLSKILGARMTGITISPVQVAIGNALAREHGVDVQLLEMLKRWTRKTVSTWSGRLKPFHTSATEETAFGR